MRKLRLKPDALRVESFAVPGSAAGPGTVRAASVSEPQTEKEEYTCGVSCLAPCIHTFEVPGCGRFTDFGCD